MIIPQKKHDGPWLTLLTTNMFPSQQHRKKKETISTLAKENVKSVDGVGSEQVMESSACRERDWGLIWIFTGRGVI